MKEERMNDNPLFSISYGLYLVSARDNGRINGCIINTIQQLCNTPEKIGAVINKHCLTHDMIKNSGKMCISILTKDTPYELFFHFGLKSGRDINKFDSVNYWLDKESLPYLTRHVNSYISCHVTSMTDLGTHSLFVGEIYDSKKINDMPSILYQDYFDYVKPQASYISDDEYRSELMMQGESVMSQMMGINRTVSKDATGKTKEDTIITPDTKNLVVSVNEPS